jgi:RNA polymerase sigma-70 factor (ECF subfamily)
MDNDQLATIYDEHFRKIYRFFYYKVLSRELAEDLTADTFMKFVEMSQTKTEHGLHPEAIRDPVKYLYGIAKLVLLEELKQKYHSIKSIPIESESDFGSYVENYLEEVDEVQTPEELAAKSIEQLPEKQKRIITLRLLEKKSLTEICELLGKDMNYVKTTQKRALHNLKAIFATGQCTPETT